MCPGNTWLHPELTESISRTTRMEAFLKGLGISSFLVETTALLGYHDPTPVQKTYIPRILAGEIVQAKAPTGTGKTAAFVIPLVELLSRDPFGVYALVLTPTRELALQIEQQVLAFGARMNIKTECIVGGKDLVAQGQALAKRRPHFVVATPGRLGDLLTCHEDVRNVFRNLRHLVIDESDCLKETQGDELQTVLDLLPSALQPLEFSATLQGVETVGERAELRETFLLSPDAMRDAYLLVLLKRFTGKSIIVFTATCEHAEAVSRLLSELHLHCRPLHSLISQRERNANLDEFRSERIPILIATDVASRGLDLPQVEVVINHNFPRSSVLYTHRIGRTGRAGKKGLAVSLVTQYDVELVLNVEKKQGAKLMPLYSEQENRAFEDEVLQVLTKMTNTQAVVSHVSST